MAIYVDYEYRRKDGSIGKGTNTFYSVNKAIRFIYSINSKPNYAYTGFECDDSDELYAMNKRL